MSIAYFTHLAAASGGLLYVILLVLLVALAVIVERTWALARIVRVGERLTETVANTRGLDRDALTELKERHRGCPHTALLSVPLTYPEVRDPDRLGQLLEETFMRQAPQIDKYLWILDTSVTLAPLLGLLGTIVGLFEAFKVLDNPNTAPAQVTGGIAEALVATAAGLLVAIIGLVFFNALNKRVRVVVNQMETLKVMLVNRFATAPEAG